MNFSDYIIRDPNICGGAPVVRGTRVTLRTLLASLAEGCDEEEILRNFPAVTKADLKAVIAFAAASAEEDLPVSEVPRFDADSA
ncbi:MAG TPA: DUF433 domain-containing protein [Thermoanaerobaculia bacterium]|nr:DUF433 domain-containing protein [Thermoanaerobaculia bacterium]